MVVTAGVPAGPLLWTMTRVASRPQVSDRNQARWLEAGTAMLERRPEDEGAGVGWNQGRGSGGLQRFWANAGNPSAGTGGGGALLSTTFQRAAAWSRWSVAQAKVTAMDETCVWSCPSRECGRFCWAGVIKAVG